MVKPGYIKFTINLLIVFTIILLTNQIVVTTLPSTSVSFANIRTVKVESVAGAKCWSEVPSEITKICINNS